MKNLLLFLAILIAGATLYVSQSLTSDLLREEESRMQVWAEAMRVLVDADEHTDITLPLSVLQSNNTIPVVVLAPDSSILDSRNVPDIATLTPQSPHLQQMLSEGHKMRMPLTSQAAREAGAPAYIDIVYGESSMLRRLRAFPYWQLGAVCFFVVLSLLALWVFKRAEQNRVWVGLSRETAHQLGTPISSLMAWSEMLRDTYPDDPLLPEMDSDIKRLQLIAERFSKIGSAPVLEQTDLRDVVTHVVEYLRRRTSPRVQFVVQQSPTPLPVRLNAPLIEWVIENLCKNAVDAMEGTGCITLTLSAIPTGALLTVADTGRGIPRGRWKHVFRPGYTTKQRGWGLGLSLARRIITEYHHGRIYVKASTLGQGTVFAIEL